MKRRKFLKQGGIGAVLAAGAAPAVAQALPEVKAAKETRLQHPPLPPSPEPTDVSLPGELPTPAEAPAAQ